MINFSGALARASWRRVVIAAVFVIGCGAAQHAESDPEALRAAGRLWVLAPHPDDEVLIAGDMLHAAVLRGRPVSVVVMTNGDLSCTRNGHARQGETIAALATLGVSESDVHFLGYPDGYLDSLGPVPLEPLARTMADGSCGTGDHTYASRGAGALDVHTSLTGSPGAYVASGPEEDLAALLRREQPTEIVTTHGYDRHPDHAMTYVYLRRALERAGIAPRILRAMVHQGPCWPNGSGEPPCPNVNTTQGTPFPAFRPPLEHWLPTLRIASPDGGELARAAIAHYTTQLETPIPEESWLSSFARTDEIFWIEDLAPSAAGRLSRVPRATGHIGEVTASAPGELTVHHVAPFVLSLAAHMEDSTGSARIELLDDGHFETLSLSLEAGGVAVRTGEAFLMSAPIPHGEDPTLAHRYELEVDPRPEEGNVADVLLRRDGLMWGVAVIARSAETSRDENVTPLFGGDHVRWTVERGALGTPTLVE